MSHSQVTIKEGAFVISDAHYSSLRPQLLSLIQTIHSKLLKPTQLILMGDIFDALFGGVKHTQELNAEIIKLLNDISLDIEVVYLEGNHDFNLQNIFPNFKIFSLKNQPVACSYKEKKIYLAHGDFDGGFGYLLYSSIIRNPLTLFILKTIDSLTSHTILKRLDKFLSKKDDCKNLKTFEEFISKRLNKKYDCDYFIEGHFHQNKHLKLENFNYINLAAFACNQRYFIVKSSKDKELLEEKIFSKGM